MNIPERMMKPEERILFSLRGLYAQYGYLPYKMRKFESYDLYAGNKDFLPSEQIIAFTDTDGALLALKPDVTLSIVRSGRDEGAVAQKVYYQENVYRPARQGQGFREITQTGIECIGAVDEYCQAEVLLLAAESLRRVSPRSVLHLSHMGLVRRLIRDAGLPVSLEAAAVEALAARSPHALNALAGQAGLPEGALDALARLINLPSDLNEALAGLPDVPESAALRQVVAPLEGTEAGRLLRLDFTTVNDLGYYNGLVFRGYVSGVPERVIAGGQYDPLLPKLGRRGGAIGFAVYLDALDRLQASYDRPDVDILLTYPEGAPAALVLDAVRRLGADGSTVCAQKAAPAHLRYGRHVQMDESGVTADA